MKTLSEVCKIVGLSRRMIQEYEKNGLAQTPETKNNYGYLLYSDDDIERLWQLRFYKELGYKKSEIKKVFDDPNYNKHESLKAQIQKLEEKKQNIENLISIAKSLDEIGVSVFSRNSNSILLEDITFDTALLMFGSAIKIISSQNNIEDLIEKGLDEEDVDLWFEKLETIMSFSAKGVPADSSKTQKVVSELYEITAKVLSPSIIMFESSLICFMPGSELAKDLDEIFGQNKSNYLFAALQTFVRNNRNNPYDLKLFETLENIEKLAIKRYTTDSTEVQFEINKLFNLVKKIKIYNEKGQLNLLKTIGELFRSNEYKKVIDKGKQRGISWFISRAIQIYIENIEGGIEND